MMRSSLQRSSDRRAYHDNSNLSVTLPSPLYPKVGRNWPYHRNRDFLLVGKSGAQGKVLIRPCSLRLTRLSQSETVGDPARRAHDWPQPQDAHATPAGAGARVPSSRTDLRWYETCGETGQGA